MKILAIDTTTNVLSVAVCEDRHVLTEYYIDHKRTHSQKLMPVIENLLSDTGIDINDIDGFAVATGPGSFTGIRIGLAAARTFAQATGKPVYPVTTLLGLAFNAEFTKKRVCTVIDARNGNLYCGVYSFVGKKCRTVLEPSFMSAEELNAYFSSKRGKTVVVGDTELLVKNNILKLDARLNIPRASSVAFAALDCVKPCKYNDADACYISKPQAQKDLEEREKNK